MVTLLRLAACSVPLLIGLTSRCFAHWARASCAPRHCHPQFAMVVPHLRTALAFGGAVFRGCALRFASCARHSSPSGLRCAQSALAALPPLSSAWSLRIVRKLTCGAPCFTGLIDGYCTLNSQWSSCCALRLAVLPCSLGLLRPVSRTARGLRAPHWLRRLFRPHWAYYGLFPPLAAAFVRPLWERGAFWLVALS